jgi:hypothetical protein
MSFLNGLRPAPVLDDWTARLPPGSLPRSVRAGVDPRLELRPGVDPGYDMPNPPPENLDQDNSHATGFLNAAWPAGGGIYAPPMPEKFLDRLRASRGAGSFAADPSMVLPPTADPGDRMPVYHVTDPKKGELPPDTAIARGFLSAAAPVDPSDFSGRYNTPLTPEQEAAYQDWGRRMAGEGGRNPAADTFDYDMRGFWKAGDGDPQFAGNGHAGDAFKKPNHPTFSDQSQYHGVDGHEGGTWGGGQDGAPWTFTPSKTNLEMRDAAELQRYFDEREQGNRLILPEPTSELQS